MRSEAKSTTKPIKVPMFPAIAVGRSDDKSHENDAFFVRKADASKRKLDVVGFPGAIK